MSNIKSQAVEKIKQGLNTYKGNRYGDVMKGYVADTLAAFSEQNMEFAQAVIDGGDFSACMGDVVKGIGSSISDLEVARKAAAFYFPGCDIKMEMTIYTSKFERDDAADAELFEQSIVLNLEDFL